MNAQDLNTITQTFLCIDNCDICKLHGMLLIHALESISDHNSSQYLIALTLRVHDALMMYKKHLSFQVENNEHKFFVKVIYTVGLLLSLFASLFIMDYYTKRQLDHDKQSYSDKLKAKEEQLLRQVSSSNSKAKDE